ncbi:MAG TPA: ABC-F family ATP-binding cassette domain-containing protein [Chitinophagales bacterium]|nr:ABC-F family ATP-binding cassette domain-containing protein [Chitinophagales bacterium]
MIAVSNIELHFSGRVMFGGISFLINDNDKIGLTGRNGAGKSTLLKVLKGLQPIDGGDIMYPKGTIIGYLPQELHSQSTLTVMNETRKAFELVTQYLDEKEKIMHEMETRTDYESDEYMELINRLGEVEHQIEIHDGYSIDEQTERVLKGLGFEPADFEKEMRTLSGGWQMRVELAKILLLKPDLILLDEPTNHLDIESVLWLEKFLKDYPGAIMMVSHDRSFLDNITNRTIEVISGDIDDYNAPYTKYIELRKERREQQINAQKNQQREIAQIERNIERFRAKASKATFAQSLIKKLDKMEIIEVEEENLAAMNLRFPQSQASGKVVVEAEHVSKRYGHKLVIDNQSFQINRGEKIAFVGKNGMGKTTLTRILVDGLEHEGTITLGHNVTVGYYAQHAADSMDGNDTALDVVDRVAVGDIRTKLRDMLGCFLFKGDDVFKKVKVLSGGEKGRLALCKMILEPRNFLVLDEPTNHLDMLSKEVLKNALKQFEGTVVIVSHDRDFLHGLTTKTFEFTKEGIKEHIGDINEFLEKKQMEDMRMLAKKEPEKKQEPRSKNQDKVNIADDRKEKEKDVKKLKGELEKCEKKIAELEAKIADLDTKLQDPLHFQELSKDPNFFTGYNNLKKQLDEEMSRWEKLEAEVEKNP